jgi:protease-4
MRLLFSLLLLSVASFCFSQDYTVTSVATSDDALAIFSNPAGMAAGRAANLGMYYNEDKDDLKRFGIATVAPGFGLAYSYWNQGARKSQISTALGSRMGETVSFGMRGRWLRLVPGTYFGLDLGLMVRPLKYISIGAVANNVNRPAIGLVTYDRDYKVGLGLRPMTDRLTLFGEWSAVEGEDIDDSHFQFGVETEPLDGIVLRGSGDKDLTFKVGLLVNFLNGNAGYTATVDTIDGLVGNGVQLGTSVDRNRTVLAGKGEIAEIRISGQIEDSPPGFSLFGGSASSLRSVVDQFEKARTDKTVTGVLLNLRRFSAGAGTAYEIRRQIERVRAADKKVVAYLEEGGMDLALYVASACDRIVVCPTSEVVVKGPYAQMMMLKGFMDKIGAEADLVRAGKYKSAVEPLTQEHLSPEAREQIQDLVDGVYEEMTVKIFTSRNIPADKMEKVLSEGISRPDRAKEAGLIDEVGYYEDAKLTIAGLVDKKADDPDKVRTTSLRKRTYREYSWREPPKVAVLLASGSIVTGPSRTDFLSGSQYMGSETLVRQLRKLRSDRSVKAVVLRVDSPGGDGLASDLIWREVGRLKKSGKPVIVSMSDVAGSGGYYISCGADRIFADPTTVTGSIGVFGGKAVLAGTYDKLGINPEVVKSAEHSDAFSPARKFTEEERKVLQDHIDYFYDDFVSKVADGRGLEKERVYELAQGRVYTGARAKELGLIDEVGTLEDAVGAAAKMANIKEKPQVVYVTKEKSFLGMMYEEGVLQRLLGIGDSLDR